MLRNIKISLKIAGIIVAVTLIVIAAIGIFTYTINLQTRKDAILNSIKIIADEHSAMLNNYFDQVTATLNFLSQLKNQDHDSTNLVSSDIMLSQIKVNYGFDAVYLTDEKGNKLFSTDSSSREIQYPGSQFFTKVSDSVKFSKVIISGDDFFVYAATHLGNKNLTVRIRLNNLYKNFKNKSLGSSMEIVITDKDEESGKILMISPIAFSTRFLFEKLEPIATTVNQALDKGNGNGLVKDYREEPVIAAWRKISAPGWILIAKIDESELTGQREQLWELYVYGGLAIVALAVALALIFANSLMNPLNEMRNTLELLSKGILPEREGSRSNDEFGLMGRKVDNLVESLKQYARFSKAVGEGKFDTPFSAQHEGDILGHALINMRNNLVENEKNDKERNWIVAGVAEVGEILRQHDSLTNLGDDVVKYIVEKISAIQGAFYDVNEKEGGIKEIVMLSSYAYNRKKHLKKSFRFAEGLVGQSAIEKDTILRKEIPEDYVSITSGLLGDKKPTCILIVPLITNDEVYGILEFAGLKDFNPSQVKFVQELSVILARTIFNIKVNERTRRLLAESQAMSVELSEKQEVLRQNAEEMQATQEELKHSNAKLEEQIGEVNRTQRRMQLLLENASEVITIYEENGSIRYISPSVESILGYSQRDIQGKSDEDKIHPDGRQAFNDLFKRLKASPDEKVTVQYEYKTFSGDYIWLEATGTNCMSNPAIHGYILNSRDITEKRRAEQEQRMRSKMQALSENSPDLITRLEDGYISYINPVIESYTGHYPSSFLNKKANETHLTNSVVEHWLRIVEMVNETNNTVSTEVDFPSKLGDRIMQVNAIPEYNESKKIESVLVVSHDITERKMIELEIQNKNKKINDSINYAKRIQNAILPNVRLINKSLKDSFILYKPRDVVSGDFPWFVQVKHDIFIAAVDCTGHGVPGALLSLIGYFLLNDIVRSRKISEPGAILDLLDEGVTQTLRQDQDDSTSKDGMDIGLCKINLESNLVEYAGAHRPLYYVKNGVQDEIKGNKFPIGGGIFKNQTNFTTQRLELNKGDSIYFCSDGYPDQFGGEEVRKFGPKRIREIIDRVWRGSMNEAVQVFDSEWGNWKGDHKQTDDVLLIGIKF